MKEVEAKKVLDGQMRRNQRAQFSGAKKMRTDRNAATVFEFDFKAIVFIVLTKFAGFLDRANIDGRGATDRPNRGDEVAVGDAADFRQDRRKIVRRKVIQNATKAQAKINAGVRLRITFADIADLKAQIDALDRKSVV